MREKNYEIKIKIKASSLKEALIKAQKLNVKLISGKCVNDIRSSLQNRAMHLWFNQIASECSNRGITMDMVVTKPQEIPITSHLLKDLFRFIGKKMFKVESTAKLEKLQFYEVQKTFEMTLIKNIELYIPFPNENTLMEKELDELNNK